MGYDLLLRPRSGKLDEDTFVECFQDRWNYTFPDEDPEVAAYRNPSTEVYFHFRWTKPSRSERGGRLDFSINFFRPHVFALEAEPELAAVIEELDLRVEDPQADGIEGDTYNGDQFLRGWNAGNRGAYAAILAEPENPTPFHIARAKLEGIWRWNYEIEATREANGGTYAGPLIGFAERKGELVTISSIDIDESFLLPRVDIVYLQRPREGSFVAWSDVASALRLVESDCIAEPHDYWAITGIESVHALQRFLRGKLEPAPITSLDLEHVHATEEIERVRPR